MRPALRLFNHHHFGIAAFNLACDIGERRHICDGQLIGLSIHQNFDLFNAGIPRAGHHQGAHGLYTAVALFGNLGEIPTEIDGDRAIADVDAQKLNALLKRRFKSAVRLGSTQKFKNSGSHVIGTVYRSGNGHEQSPVLRREEDLNFVAVRKRFLSDRFPVQADACIRAADV